MVCRWCVSCRGRQQGSGRLRRLYGTLRLLVYGLRAVLARFLRLLSG
jgi:hypothetical protein